MKWMPERLRYGDWSVDKLAVADAVELAAVAADVAESGDAGDGDRRLSSRPAVVVVAGVVVAAAAADVGQQVSCRLRLRSSPMRMQRRPQRLSAGAHKPNGGGGGWVHGARGGGVQT